MFTHSKMEPRSFSLWKKANPLTPAEKARPLISSELTPIRCPALLVKWVFSSILSWKQPSSSLPSFLRTTTTVFVSLMRRVTLALKSSASLRTSSETISLKKPGMRLWPPRKSPVHPRQLMLSGDGFLFTILYFLRLTSYTLSTFPSKRCTLFN